MTYPSKVFVEDDDYGIEQMFMAGDFSIVHKPEYADIICWSGGSDVTPGIYNDVRHKTTWCDVERDTRCKLLWDKARPDQFRVGICRGSQFLNVMNGGTLWQDVDQHAIAGEHVLYYDINATDAPHQEIPVTSTHHQMMRPNMLATVWGWCYRSTFRDLGGDDHRQSDFKKEGPDIEIVHYPKTKTLCFQPHPEYGYKPTEDLFWDCLTRLINFKGE